MFPEVNEIRRLRDKVGWSQKQLANFVGVSQSAITKYESGNQIPSYEIGTKIFSLLIEQETLLDREVTSIMTKTVYFAYSKDLFGEILELMQKKSISQIPVMKKTEVVGTITETNILNLLDKYHSLQSLKNQLVEEVMEEPLPIVPPSAKIKEITPLLRRYNAVIIRDKTTIRGIVTKADLIDV